MNNKILLLVKANLGISTNIRDELLNFLINSTTQELETEHKINIIEEREELFLIDYVCFKYKNREFKEMPRFLKLRLHNLKIGRFRR